MEELAIYQKVRNYDPTRTTLLRNKFSADMKKRFLELALVIKRSVYDNDCFGLKKNTLQIHQMNPVVKEAFKFNRSADKVQAFEKWLQEQIDKGIIELKEFQQVGASIEAAWTNRYIYDSYKRAVIRARYELIKAGYNVPSIENSGGINVVMMSPFHLERVGLLFTRVFTDLKGITSAMDSQISRILSQGIIDGDGPALLARKLVSVLKDDLSLVDTLGRFIPAMRRAEMLARTEIIRTFAEATLNEFENWGVEGVTALAEFQNAGDDRVCPVCEGLQGKIYTLKEAHGVIPVHTFCRCCWLPAIKELEKYKN